MARQCRAREGRHGDGANVSEDGVVAGPARLSCFASWWTARGTKQSKGRWEHELVEGPTTWATVLALRCMLRQGCLAISQAT